MKDYESKLLNGESFNYADRNNRKHDLLDGTPPGRFDTSYVNRPKGSGAVHSHPNMTIVKIESQQLLIIQSNPSRVLEIKKETDGW